MTAIVRVVMAARLLQQQPWTKAELAARLGVSERAVKRYLGAIREAGVKVEHQDDSMGVPGGDLPRVYWIGEK